MNMILGKRYRINTNQKAPHYVKVYPSPEGHVVCGIAGSIGEFPMNTAFVLLEHDELSVYSYKVLTPRGLIGWISVYSHETIDPVDLE